MIFKESRNLKSFISRLMFGIYFFALFSSGFHSHDASAVFSGFNEKKSEKSISKTDAKENAGDCLACHFLATGSTLLPDEFSFTLLKPSQDTAQIIALQEEIWTQTKFTFQLRGPPANS